MVVGRFPGVKGVRGVVDWVEFTPTSSGDTV